MLVRILYAHMVRRKGMSSAKHSLHTRRNMVLAFLAGLKPDELAVFVDFMLEVCCMLKRNGVARDNRVPV